MFEKHVQMIDQCDTRSRTMELSYRDHQEKGDQGTLTVTAVQTTISHPDSVILQETKQTNKQTSQPRH